jgi:hypothetical protein
MNFLADEGVDKPIVDLLRSTEFACEYLFKKYGEQVYQIDMLAPS